jgi:hypothetical protein
MSSSSATESVPATATSDVSNVLVVPAHPLNRSATIVQPKNLPLILSVCGQALKKFGDQPINAVKILILIQHIIVAVKKLTKLEGEEQQKLVMDSIRWLIDNQKGLSDEEKNTLDIISETIFIQAIELLSDKESFTSCISCFSKK